MIASIRKAHGAGVRAGLSPPRYLRHGGERLRTLSEPLNPFDNVFAPRWRPLLALIWRSAYELTRARHLVSANNGRKVL